MIEKNSQYWIDRAKEIDKLDIKNEKDLLKELIKLYEKAYNETLNELYAFYAKYGDEHGLSYKEAQKLLQPIELKECSARIRRLSDMLEKIDKSTPFGKARASQIQREIQLLRGRGRITREQALLDSINEKWIDTAYKVDKKLGDLIKETYTREFKHSLEQAGVQKVMLPVKALESALLMPTFGNHFSDTIWKNKDKLVAFIRSEIRTGLVRGTNVRKTAKKLEKLLNVTAYEAKRLVVTENCIARTQGSLDGYMKSDVVQYLCIIVAMDEKTCVDCRDQETAIIKKEEAQVGVNIPPFHPNCRCAVAPYFE